MRNENQEQAIAKLSRLKVGALFMEMGTGKTRVALDLIASKVHKVDMVLWICPFSLKQEIENEVEKWHPHLELNVVGCESIGASDRIFMELLEKVQTKKAFIVVDESLKIKNIYAKRTRRIIELGDHAQYKLILNGTPVSKNILDLWTQMEFLSPKILNMTYNEFRDSYCEYYTSGRLKGLVRKQHNVPHLIAKIEPYIFDCELDIDTKKVHYVEHYWLDDRQAYEEYKNELLYEYLIGEDDFNFKAYSIKLQKWYVMNSNRDDMLRMLLDRIDDRVIVFVKYLDSIPYDAMSITGSKTALERKQTIKDFKDNKFKILYITYGCGSFGFNLQFCKNMVFAEQTWDYAQRIQSEARIYRIGQGSNVNYYDFLCEGVGLEEMIQRCLNKKVSLLDEMKLEIERTSGGVKEWLKNI